MKTNHFSKYIKLVLLFVIFTTILNVQKKVGDQGIIFDTSKFDSRYPQMKEWQKAGVRGGIPPINGIRIVKTLNPNSNADNINRAINDAAENNSGHVGILLKNGTYTINKEVKMKSNVSLIGESRNGVRCIITYSKGSAFFFNGIKKSGIYRLTIEGSWGIPKYKWNYGISKNDELPNNNSVSVKIKKSEDCWLDQVNIFNSVDSPSKHCTFRDLNVKGAHKKAGGAQGYFFIQGGWNLITGCEITHLRHISLQGNGVKYNGSL